MKWATPPCAPADIGRSVAKLAQIESNHFYSQLVMSLLLSFDLDSKSDDYEGTPAVMLTFTKNGHQ